MGIPGRLTSRDSGQNTYIVLGHRGLQGPDSVRYYSGDVLATTVVRPFRSTQEREAGPTACEERRQLLYVSMLTGLAAWCTAAGLE